MHTPVLLQQVIEGLNIKKGGRYIDATCGEGGHLKSILSKGAAVLAIDLDPRQIENLKTRLQGVKNLKLIAGNFSEIEKIARQNNFYPVDGILFDLGLSMRQVQKLHRGFSFENRQDPLDMRLDTQGDVDAAYLINSLNESEIYELLVSGSEEINSRSISHVIVSQRKLRKILTVADLNDAIDQALSHKDKKVYARVFQALRVAVNDEFENLKKGLAAALKLINIDGRIVVLTFHSLEDRIVKNFARHNNVACLTEKIERKSRRHFERSTKLRIILKKT